MLHFKIAVSSTPTLRIVKTYRFFLFFTKQLQDAFQRVSDESAQQKEALHALKQKESKATNMVTELTAVRFLEL